MTVWQFCCKTCDACVCVAHCLYLYYRSWYLFCITAQRLINKPEKQISKILTLFNRLGEYKPLNVVPLHMHILANPDHLPPACLFEANINVIMSKGFYSYTGRAQLAPSEKQVCFHYIFTQSSLTVSLFFYKFEMFVHSSNSAADDR